jgi:hypothetical protein
MSTVQIKKATTGGEPFAASASGERVELAERHSDGISVALHWIRGTDAVAVTVEDARTGQFFEVVVAENERALDVFHHPYASAHARGMDVLCGPRSFAVDPR